MCYDRPKPPFTATHARTRNTDLNRRARQEDASSGGASGERGDRLVPVAVLQPVALVTHQQADLRRVQLVRVLAVHLRGQMQHRDKYGIERHSERAINTCTQRSDGIATILHSVEQLRNVTTCKAKRKIPRQRVTGENR